MYHKAFFLVAALWSLPLITKAHDGHGLFFGHQPEHYLSSPGHAIPLALVTLVFAVFIFYRRRVRG